MRVAWMPTLPWWLRPWHTAKLRGESVRSQHTMIMNQANMISRVKADNRELRDRVRRLENPPLVEPGSALDRPGSIVPDFVLAGFRRGNGGGVRLTASRDLDGTDLSMTDISDPPTRWKLVAKLGHALFIDRADYGSAIEEMARIWRNWEREDAQAAGQVTEGPRAIEGRN